MSLNSHRTPVAVRVRQQLSLGELLFEEGVDLIRGQLEDVFSPVWELSQKEADWIEKNRKSLDEDDLKEFIGDKSPGARWMAWQIFHNAEPDLRKLASDWAAHKDIQKWMRTKEPQWLKNMDLVAKHPVLDENGNYVWEGYQKLYWYRSQAKKLTSLGIRFAWEAERFCNLYEQLCVAGRSWGSSYQPIHGKIKALALTPNYNHLPLWVKKVLVTSPHWVQDKEGRIGDIWRLVDCAKAWKWCPNLPKGIAEKVGKMSVKSRVAAAIAWNRVGTYGSYGTTGWVHWRRDGWKFTGYDRTSGTYRFISRKDLTLQFWNNFREVSKLSLFRLIEEAQKEGFSHNRIRVLVEQALGLPFKFLWDAWGKGSEASLEKYGEVIATYGSPADACEHLFGCKGKATVKAFQASNRNAWKWAAALAHGNPDLVQKYLSLKECIEYEPAVIDFLKELGDSPALRMVGTTTFRIRGEIKPLEPFHIKDTGYLWNQIHNKPELGRVRCWLTVHEELARRFVAEQPDNALYVDPRWLPLDGLCAVDGNWQLELPRRTATLKLWGEQLHHCVGGYGPRVNRTECVIFAVKLDGWVKYTVEMCPVRDRWFCNQFYGDRNSSPPASLKSSVLAALQQAGLAGDAGDY